MKAAIISAIIIMICTASFPVIFVKNDEVKQTVAQVFYMKENPKASTTAEKADAKENFKIKISDTEKVKTVPAKEYIIGVLCGEISPSYSKEAIKAQAVAAYTFAVRRAAVHRKNGDDFDLTDSEKTDQRYIEKAKIFEKWGEKAEEYYKIFESAVNEVSGQTVTYGGEPALTVYHAVSSGVTNSSKDVWGSELPYLVSVDSVGDKLCKWYLSEAVFSENELAERLKGKCEIKAGENAFSDTEVAESGRVTAVNINGKKLKGEEIVSALSLKSGNFEVSYGGGNYTFTVKGSGHGVGMSQQGAEYMARQGSSYEEILLHYYKGCTLKK